MAEEHEARQPYKCAVCGAKFDSQDQLQNHLKSCTQKKELVIVSRVPLTTGHATFRPVIRGNAYSF
jgi:DNA-directed RNA polymerase subunit RPC12/RpoP